MDNFRDKVVGSWFGMAVGDAMGSGVRGLKPQTIAQCFKETEGYKDVRPFIGKGIKQYRTQGLYGSLTQSALVVCDTLLQSRKVDLDAISQALLHLATGGRESEFGVFRHCRSSLRRTIEEIPSRTDPRFASQHTDFCDYVAMSVPIALYFHDQKSAMMKACMEVGLLMSKHPWEAIGMALNGFLTARFLAEGSDNLDSKSLAPEKILSEAIDFCVEAEDLFKHMQAGLWNDLGDKGPALSRTFMGLGKNFSKMDEVSRMQWICENASTYYRTPVTHPSQGYILTLLPLALSMVLKPERDFATTLADAMNQGREADKLCVLAGAWAGALYGYSRIPVFLQTGLVNAREIRLRGEALANRKASKGAKVLYEMESALTSKEYEDSRKFVSKKINKQAQKPVKPMGLMSEEDGVESLIPSKEDAFAWRKYQRDKSRNKRGRRRNIGSKDIDFSVE